MTPERLAEIRAGADRTEQAGFAHMRVHVVRELLAEVDRLRKMVDDLAGPILDEDLERFGPINCSTCGRPLPCGCQETP